MNEALAHDWCWGEGGVMLFRQFTPHHNQTNIAMQMKLPEIAQFLVLALYCVAAAAFGSLETNVKSQGLLVIFILVIHSL